ncbi:Protein kinase-like domain containing protein [Rhypophila decipiens]
MGQLYSTISEAENIETLSAELNERQECCSELNFEYIPADALDQLITVRSVLDCVGSLLSTCHEEEDAEAIVQHAKRAFAILIMSSCESIAYDLIIKQHMTDQYLPLSRLNGETVVGTGPDGRKTFDAFGKLSSRRKFDYDFQSAQWRVLAPIFGGGNQHLVLHSKQPLPLQGWDVISPGTDNCVMKSALHPAHHIANSAVVTSADAKQAFLDVAIKKLIRKSDFDHEEDVLVKTRDLGNPHLIKHIATYEIQRRDGGEYYIMFPLADGGDLLDLWKTKPKAPRTPELILWSLEQMLGIASGIQDLHEGFPGETHCRHGDLKPRNIFHFRGSTSITTDLPLGQLVIADLGISRIHDKPTFKRNELTGTKATTPAYEPPEALRIIRRNSRKPWSRRYDMWSLGCIFLEFAIWLFHDLDGLEGFGEQRGEGHFYSLVDDNGRVDGVDDMESAVLSPKVKEAMDALREDERRCGGTTGTEVGPLGQLVNLIEGRLLVIDAEGRCEAHDLVNEMRKIVETAKNDPGRYFGGMLDKDNFLNVPDVFKARRGSFLDDR